jgi:hypothetical protein
MTINNTIELFDLILKSIAVISAIGAAAWGINKLWLSSIYPSKMEMKKTIDEAVEPFITTRSELHSLKQDFAVFKASDDGHKALIDERMQTMKEMQKEILHKVNNISNVDHKRLLEMVIDEKLLSDKK